MVNLLERRPAAADVQARRHRDHARRPRRRDRRRRRPLRAGPLHLRHHHRHRPRRCGPSRAATTRSTTCSTPTPGCRVDPAQRRRPRPRPAGRRRRPRRCSRTRRRASCCGRSPSSRGWSRPPRSCASRTGWRATSRRPPATFHQFYDACRVLPMGDEEPAPTPRRPAAAGRGDPHGVRQRPRPARGLRPRADVSRAAPTRPAGLHADGAPAGPSWLRAPADVNAPGPAAVVVDRAQERRRRPRGRRGRPARPGRRARLPGVRPRRGRLPGPRPRLPRGVRGLRRLLRRQGVPVHDGRALGRRGGALPRRLLRRRADRRAAGRLRPGPDRLPRQQQDHRRAARARSRPASAGSSSTPSTRSTGSPR